MLKQQLIDNSKYNVKCPYSMSPVGICVHNTANDAPAQKEIEYMQSNNNEVSFHIAIDDIEAIQGIQFSRNAWHAGDGGSGKGNRNYIAIEICYSKSGGDRFVKAEQRAAEEIAALLKKYGWGIDRVKKHQDFSGKYCPHRTLDMGWNRFINMIQAELNGNTTSKPNPTGGLYRVRKSWGDAKSQLGAYSILDNAKGNCPSGYSIFDSNGNKVYPVEVPVNKIPNFGTFYPTETIYFRNEPNTNSSNTIIGTYKLGESVNYDKVVETDSYTWISWVSLSTGIRRYMPIYDKKADELWGEYV